MWGVSNALISTINVTGSYKILETFHDPVSALNVGSGPVIGVSDCIVLRPSTDSCQGFIKSCCNTTQINSVSFNTASLLYILHRF